MVDARTQAEFDQAVKEVRVTDGPIKPTLEDQKLFYGLFKQANEGDVNTPKPGMMQFTERGKWTAWESQKGKSEEAAKKEYVQALFAILDRIPGPDADAIKKRVTDAGDAASA
ncbi:acyl CoA binding protein-domain-containing protein [Filobasidium floriforme]|uniref:acyl CoA binding protein-domain-containing protein n=1 Tax=Filobasidium floriforme TaxID=5210 RepID=UPI001E8EDF68|nr:acyl CoA binding protein-domain-containing protein [Filobasidium floriforme]KAH8078328.1 acyl CoA binding protein-domain-containing protein [Filobasidium floriforme]